jgi:hypothetical protein
MKKMGLWRWATILGACALLATGCGGDGGGGGGGGGGTDTGTDTGGDTGGTPGTGRDWITAECTEFNEANVTFPTQKTDGRPVRMIIEAVDFRTSTFVVRNVSSQAFNFEPMVRRMCGNNVQSNCTDATYSVPAGARVAIHLVRDPNRTQPRNSDKELFVWGNPAAFTLSAASGEVGVRDNSNSSVVAEMFEAFVIWGADPPSAAQSGRDEAASVGLWASNTAGAFATTSAGDVGLVATGEVTDPSAWVAVGGHCFPPNLLP